jgi:hypothetical protein
MCTFQTSIDGLVAFKSSSGAPLIRIRVFNIDEDDVFSHNVSIRYPSEDAADIKCMEDIYNQYYPRIQGSFNPQFIMVITWNLVRNMNDTVNTDLQTNLFQLGLVHSNNRVLAQFNYHTIDWDTFGASFAQVGIDTCSNIYRHPSSEAAGVGNAVTTGSNLQGRQGEWLYLIDETGQIRPAALCKAGCSLLHGSCEIAGECNCATGYRGGFCDEPICLNNCTGRGTCSNPNNCTCIAMWSGEDCSVPDCPTACTRYNNGGCTTPNDCVCNSGWTGENCETPICNPDCNNYNGICALPDTCRCVIGWNGTICDVPVCVNITCVNGECTAPETCTCSSGWTGNNCSEMVISTSDIPMSSSSIITTTVITTTTAATEPSNPPTVEGTTLSGQAIGAIAGGIGGFVVLVLIIIVIAAAIACVMCSW